MQYHLRILHKYKRPLCTLIILGDSRRNWRPTSHQEELFGCVLQLKFPTRKLLDYPAQAEQPQNPFSWLVAAHRQSHLTRGHPSRRQVIKFQLVRGLYHAGLGPAQVREFFNLIDWLLALPKDLEYDFRRQLAEYEEELKMVYVNSVERILREEIRAQALAEGEAAGEARGEATGIRKSILQTIAWRWPGMEIEFSALLETISDAEKLSALHAQAVQADSAAQLKAQLENPSAKG